MSEDDEVTELLKAACPTTRVLEASQGISNPQAGETDPAPEPVSGQQAGSGKAAANDRTLKQGQLATDHKRRRALQRTDKATAGGTLQQAQSVLGPGRAGKCQVNYR